ncbi:TonB-dependent receptor plug domain-containing protein [Cellvibrio zantedeschiae]|uniref:TonB-dependent receptor plug domain-containing protein n=1 Tax=Cellvibrio zantedeschiae TaxID=1237077 RepID=UPI0016768A1B|nr:TonB-dependent receptor [Cellvibrio zantedeschiae]
MKIRKIAPKKFVRIYRAGLLASSCGLVWPAYGLESNNYFDLTLEQLLDTKVLSVSKKVETVAAAPAAVYVVTNEDILRAGVTSIPDALRMVPGVDVARSDSNSWAISIRGFNSTLTNKLLVLIDGRSIYNPVFGGVLWEAQNLVLADIDRIEVVRGPGGTLWGANAVNGVINIITKHTRDTKDNIVSALGGNEETNLAVRHGGALDNDGAYRVYAKAFRRDASHSPAGGDAYDKWDGVRTGFRVDWSDKFTLQGDAYRTNTLQRKPNFSLTPPYAAVTNQEIVYEGVNLLGRWTEIRDNGAQFSVQSYIDWARRDEPLNFIDNRTTYDLEAQYNFAAMGAHELITGAGIRFMADDKTGNRNVSFSPKQLHSNLYNAFVQDKITLAPERWFLTLGSKFEHNDFSGFEVQPNVRLQWHPNQTQTLWASVSRAVRTPTPVEEDLTSTLLTAANARAAFVPNDDFKSEKLTAYELGYRQQITPTLSADVATFYNDYDYLATTSVQPVQLINNGVDPLHILIPIKFTNDMTGKSRGAEAAFNWSVNSNLKIALNYTYLRLAVTALNSEQESAELLYPKHQAGIKVFWNITGNWTLDGWAAHVDKLPGGNVDDYTRLDINLGGQLTKNLRFNLVGQNLLDKRHREFGAADDINAAEIERSIFGKLTWSF